MKRRHQLTTAVILALLATTLAANGALAHASDDASLAHQILDSDLTPFLALGVIGVVSFVWWRKVGQRES